MFACLLVSTNVVTTVIALAVGVAFLLLFLLWMFFFERSLEKEKNVGDNCDDNFEIKINRYVIGTMIFFVVIFGVCAVLCLILYLAKVPDYLSFGETIGCTCGIGCAALIFAILCVLLKRWRVIVCGCNITFISSFGKRRDFEWKDITKAEKGSFRDGSIIKIYFSHDKKPAFTVNGLMPNAELLLKKLQKSGKLSL